MGARVTSGTSGRAALARAAALFVAGFAVGMTVALLSPARTGGALR